MELKIIFKNISRIIEVIFLTKIYPSILAANFNTLGTEIDKVLKNAEGNHLDIMMEYLFLIYLSVFPL